MERTSEKEERESDEEVKGSDSDVIGCNLSKYFTAGKQQRLRARTLRQPISRKL